MRTLKLKRLQQVGSALGCWALISAAVPATASAQDYMGMAELYGQGVVNILGTEIRNDGIRQSMGGVKGSTPAPGTVWPRNISDASVKSHVFTVDELAAMRYSDDARAKRLLDGQEISVTGVVERDDRSDRSFSMRAGDANYRVWASWPRGTYTVPASGTVVTLRGVADLKRRTSVNMASPKLTLGRKAPGPADPSAAPTAGAAAGAADYGALTFRTSGAVTRDLASKFADTLAPSLSAGYSRKDIEDLVNSGRLQTTFASLLKPYGFSDRDMADVMASHLIMSWQIANNHPEDGPRSGVLAVRGEVREALARAGWVQGLSDAEKQAFSETLAVGTMLIAARYLDGREAGDRAMVAAAAQDAQAMVRGYGNVDLTRLKLTAKGFEPR